MSLLDCNDNINNGDAFDLYINAYIKLVEKLYKERISYNILTHKYMGIIGEYANIDELVVVSKIKYHVIDIDGDEFNYSRIKEYYLISINHPLYRKEQYGDYRGKPYHCDYYAGSPVTLKLIAKYILNRN